VPHRVLVDGAAGALLASGMVTHVLVGADRIAANGDTANKVGTYSLAVLARHHGVPFVVVAPTSTVDPATPSGGAIVVEERSGAEVTPRFPVWNPAFDVTPAELVDAIVTEAGVHRAPYGPALASALASAGARS
jgi:methylthioribose-1-phosphate isomerase